MRPICLGFQLQRPPHLPPRAGESGEGSGPAPARQGVPSAPAARSVCVHAEEEWGDAAALQGEAQQR